MDWILFNVKKQTLFTTICVFSFIYTLQENPIVYYYIRLLIHIHPSRKSHCLRLYTSSHSYTPFKKIPLFTPPLFGWFALFGKCRMHSYFSDMLTVQSCLQCRFLLCACKEKQLISCWWQKLLHLHDDDCDDDDEDNKVDCGWLLF